GAGGGREPPGGFFPRGRARWLGRGRRIVLPALLCLTFAAGCGGGSKETTTEVATSDGQPLSKADYIEVADNICRNHQSRREDLESQARDIGALTSPAKARQVAGLLREEAGNLRDEAHELENLTAPEVGRARVAAIIGDIRARADAIDRWARAYEGPDESAIRQGQIQVGIVTDAAEKAAQGDGFGACGR